MSFTPAAESCNEIDDDCDGEVDEDLIDGLFYDGEGAGMRPKPTLNGLSGAAHVLWR